MCTHILRNRRSIIGDSNLHLLAISVEDDLNEAALRSILERIRQQVHHHLCYLIDVDSHHKALIR